MWVHEWIECHHVWGLHRDSSCRIDLSGVSFPPWVRRFGLELIWKHLNSYKGQSIGCSKSRSGDLRRFLILPADILLAYQHDIEQCAQLLRASSLMPLVTTELYDYENLVLVIGSDNSSAHMPPPTLLIVKNRIDGGNEFMPSISVWKSTESFKNLYGARKG